MMNFNVLSLISFALGLSFFATVNAQVGAQIGDAETKWQKSFYQAGKIEKEKISGGLISTIKFGVNVANYQKEVNVEDLLTIEQKNISVGSRDYKIDIAHKVYDPKFPTVVAHFGFSGDVREGNAKYFAINFHKEFPNYNLLLIQTMASATFSNTNCHYPIGGLDEAHSVIKLTKQYLEEKKLNKEIFIIGGSSSSAALFHSSVYFSKHSDIKVRGFFLQSGFNNMSDIINVLYSQRENFISRRTSKKKLRKINAKEQILATALLGKRMKDYKLNKECDDRFILQISITELFEDPDLVETQLYKAIQPMSKLAYYYELVEQSFRNMMLDIPDLYSEIYKGKDFSPKTVLEYYEGIDISKHVTHLDFPMFWLHAEDDPMSDYKLVEKGQRRLKRNANFARLMLKNGGHSAFKEVQGEEFLNGILRNFLEYDHSSSN